MQKILISACLLGCPVRYDGKHNQQTHLRLMTLQAQGLLVTICPEVAGGLATPRDPAEIYPGNTARDVIAGNGHVLTNQGKDVSAEFLAGAQAALELTRKHNIRVAILKARSPSCGSQQIYDGSFSRQLIPGMGVTAALLSQQGVQVFNEEQIDAALDALEANPCSNS